MKSLRDEIPLTRGYGEADLISSEALAEDFIQTRLDFILQSTISLKMQGCALIYLQKCGIINSPINKNLMERQEICGYTKVSQDTNLKQ